MAIKYIQKNASRLEIHVADQESQGIVTKGWRNMVQCLNETEGVEEEEEEEEGEDS